MDVKQFGFRSDAGFTLAEMAVVVLLISIAMTMGLKVTLAHLHNSAYSETKSKQERVKTALIGYLRSNGRLPCPDSTVAIATGQEVSNCGGTVAAGWGVVPWQTLGLSRGDVQDGWGNLFSYYVSNAQTVATQYNGEPPLHTQRNQIWTNRTDANAFDIRSLSSTTANGYQSVLIQNREPGPGLLTEQRNVIAVILSHGKNGLGAKTINAATRIAGAANDELENTNVDITFIRRPYTEDTAATGGAFDDIVAYMTPQDLLNPLMAEGTLKGCTAYCASTSSYSPNCSGTGTCGGTCAATAYTAPVPNTDTCSVTCSCTESTTPPPVNCTVPNTSTVPVGRVNGFSCQ